ncbi:MAG TPA: CmpA/NrtA family ABC transporter substrate-binding protein [Caulobacteraceae bacterium]|jgi:NitT/TauT family transport system ATP-binding protein/nitrate/nitrite transport system substrate-binding protein
MSGRDVLRLGFVPLVDSVALMAAQELGLFQAEGVRVELVREVSWATVRDKIAVGALDGAHMLAPLAIAATLGIGSDPAPMIAPVVLNLTGPSITLSGRVSAAMRDEPSAAALADLVRRRREEGSSPLTFASVYPYSVHTYLLRGWLAAAGIDPDRDVRLTVAPPSRMAELLDGGVVEGFCAGEPWNRVAVSAGSGRIVARAADLRERTPDKVFGVTRDWAADNPDALLALVRAIHAAADWLAAPDHRDAAAEMLSAPHYIGVDADLIEPGLDEMVQQHGAATAPDPADAIWLVGEMLRCGQAPAGTNAEAVAAEVFRRDLYEAALPPSA